MQRALDVVRTLPLRPEHHRQGDTGELLEGRAGVEGGRRAHRAAVLGGAVGVALAAEAGAHASTPGQLKSGTPNRATPSGPSSASGPFHCSAEAKREGLGPERLARFFALDLPPLTFSSERSEGEGPRLERTSDACVRVRLRDPLLICFGKNPDSIPVSLVLSGGWRRSSPGDLPRSCRSCASCSRPVSRFVPLGLSEGTLAL